MEASVSRKHIIVSGRVQGVGFRWYARERATDLGLAGWVRNLADGRVELVVQGDPDMVAEMEAWCRRGSPSASVRSVQASDEAPLPCECAFEVR